MMPQQVLMLLGSNWLMLYTSNHNGTGWYFIKQPWFKKVVIDRRVPMKSGDLPRAVWRAVVCTAPVGFQQCPALHKMTGQHVLNHDEPSTMINHNDRD